MKVPRIGRSSFHVDYTIHNGGGKIFAAAKTVMVCFDGKKGETVPLPEDFKNHLT